MWIHTWIRKFVYRICRRDWGTFYPSRSALFFVGRPRNCLLLFLRQVFFRFSVCSSGWFYRSHFSTKSVSHVTQWRGTEWDTYKCVRSHDFQPTNYFWYLSGRKVFSPSQISLIGRYHLMGLDAQSYTKIPLWLDSDDTRCKCEYVGHVWIFRLNAVPDKKTLEPVSFQFF